MLTPSHESEVLLTGFVYARDEVDAALRPASKAVLCFRPAQGGLPLIANANAAGAYVAPLTEGDCALKVVDEGPFSPYAAHEVQVNINRLGGAIQRRHVTLAEAPSPDQGSFCTAVVYKEGKCGGRTPITDAKVVWYCAKTGEIVDDCAPPTNVFGVPQTQLKPGKYFAKVYTKNRSIKEYGPRYYDEGKHHPLPLKL